MSSSEESKLYIGLSTLQTAIVLYCLDISSAQRGHFGHQLTVGEGHLIIGQQYLKDLLITVRINTFKSQNRNQSRSRKYYKAKQERTIMNAKLKHTGSHLYVAQQLECGYKIVSWQSCLYMLGRIAFRWFFWCYLFFYRYLPLRVLR